MTQITKNFTLAELTHSATGEARGLANVPSAAELANIKRTAEVLQKVRDHFGVAIIVTSCFRSEAVNKAVGGSPTSAHRFGLAADINAAGMTSRQFAERLRAFLTGEGIGFDQIILEFPDEAVSWVHLGIATESRRRNQLLTASKVAGKTIYEPGLK